MKYDVDYFIRKFQAIPDGKWCVGIQIDEDFKRCAYGWCIPKIKKDIYGSFIMEGAKTKEGLALTKVFNGPAARINNGLDARYQQSTPKRRILAALYDIKKLQDDKTKTEPKERIKTVYVSVPESIVNQSKELILQ